MLKKFPRKTRWSPEEQSSLRLRVRRVVFEADSRPGQLFDIALIGLITISTLAVIFESVASIRADYETHLQVIEWILTMLFTAEYMVRLWAARSRWGYARSYYGIIDLLALLPTYLSLLLPGSHYMLTIRLLRVMRVFRVLRLTSFVGEASHLQKALRASARKIMVFLFSVLLIVVVMGSVMYLVEGPKNGFTSIPTSIYWTIVTLTTVGFGDITPSTGLGRVIASMIMVMGYGIIAVPTGIVTVELAGLERKRVLRTCPACMLEGHEEEANFCRGCGAPLEERNFRPDYEPETLQP